MENKEKYIRILCDCGHAGHFFEIRPWDDDESSEMWIAVCEADRGVPFLRRLQYAIKYIVGDTHLSYTEIIFRREELKKIVELCTKTR